MATYLGLVLKTAFSRWGTRTDLASGVLGALVPCAFVLTGRPVPENVSLLVAEIAVGVVAGWILIRLLHAPYLIWTADQAKLKELQEKLDDPKRLRKEALEQATLQARSDFAIEMRKYLDGFNASYLVHNFNAEVLDWLNVHAVLFSNDFQFQEMWKNFIYVFERERSVTKISTDLPDPDGFIEIHLNQNLGYYSQTRRMLARHIIAYLMYDENIKSDWMTETGKIKQRYIDMGMVEFYDDATLAEALARRSPSVSPEGTTPGSRPD